MNSKAPRGTKDLFGKNILYWHKIEDVIRKVCRTYAVREIRTPIFEHTELFVKSTGESSDVVKKEMYTFEDKGGRSLTLKPEGTPGTVRAFIENGMMDEAKPTKLYYVSPFFRYEKPQAGRYRQFHQFGVELFGSYSPLLDAEAIAIAHRVITELGIKNTVLYINSLGCVDCRKQYNDTLKNFIAKNIGNLCGMCHERFELNPLRVLDCKNENCQSFLKNSPSVLDCLAEECCKKDFDFLQEVLNKMDIPFVVDHRIVRGLDYYTQTVFEFVCADDLGAQSTLCGGGRYDTLIKNNGGKDTGAVGFGMGIERLLLVIENQNLLQDVDYGVDIYIGGMGENGIFEAIAKVQELRKMGYIAESDTVGRSVKAQLKYADKIGAKFSAIIGDNEIQTKKLSIKNMETGGKLEVGITEIEQFLQDSSM